MGAFHLVRRAPRQGPGDETARAERSFARQGFGAPERLHAAGCDILLYRKIVPGQPANLYRGPDGGFVAATGAPIYRERTGEAALALIARDLAAGTIDWRALYGNYAVIAARGDELRLFTDPLGVYHVFHDRDLRIVSSSFLAMLETLPPARLDAQAACEYVFQEATYGGATLAEEIALFDRTRELAIGAGASLRPLAGRNLPAPVAPDPAPEAEHVARNLANLRREFQAIAAAYGDAVDTALSGGYDSRLILALLRERGVTPRVHVYGADGDADVAVAKRIAAGEGFPLIHTDKSRAPRLAPEEFAALVRRNMDAFHGAPPDGVFENGTDLATRFERAAGGAVALNGGGGEVFRNFFHLPDRAFTARELVWSFYSRLDPRAIRPPYSARAYEDAMAAKLAATAGGGAIMSRAQIEYLYPVFRCGYWMGRNNAINNRLGGALTPFIDANVVPAALAVPLALKNAGRFEAALIRAVDPKLAAYASAYGHDFAHRPPLKARAAERIGLARPPWLRRHTFRLRHRRPEPRPWFLSDAYVGRVIDLSFPCVAKLFDTARIVEAGQYNRLCTLELLCETHGLRP